MLLNNNFSKLPNELINSLFLNLNLKNLIACSQVCVLFHKIIEEPQIWFQIAHSNNMKLNELNVKEIKLKLLAKETIWLKQYPPELLEALGGLEEVIRIEEFKIPPGQDSLQIQPEEMPANFVRGVFNNLHFIAYKYWNENGSKVELFMQFEPGSNQDWYCTSMSPLFKNGRPYLTPLSYYNNLKEFREKGESKMEVYSDIYEKIYFTEKAEENATEIISMSQKISRRVKKFFSSLG